MSKRFIYSSILATATAAAGIAMILPESSRNYHVESDLERTFSVTPVNATQARNKKASSFKASAISSSLVFYDDFESVTGEEPYSLPQGWTSLPNPSLESDQWLAGRLYDKEDGQMPGSSGEKYAFLLPDSHTSHDTWMFTPGFTLEAGENYQVAFSTIMRMHLGITESLKVVLCKKPQAGEDSELETILDITERFDSWNRLTGYISVEQSGEYYLGFHAVSVANAGGICIDDVSISNLNAPVFYGQESIRFDSKLSVHGAQTTTYKIWNDGHSPLDIKLKGCSDEISVSGLPAVIQEECELSINVTLDVKEAGAYEGHITFETNDPLSPEITVKVYQQVNETIIGSGKMHNFDDGTPDGYIEPGNLIGVGLRNTRGIKGTTFDGLATADHMASIFTDYVELGDDPQLKFSYRLNGEDYTYNDNGYVVDSEDAVIEVFVTDDYEKTWVSVFKMGPKEAEQHVATKKFREISIDLSEFADKRCRARIAIGHASGNIMDLMNNHFGFTLDNIMLGTQAHVDLALASLLGDNIVRPGEEHNYSVIVENLGDEDSPSYDVVLQDDAGTVVGKSTDSGLKPNEVKEFTFKWQSSEQPGTYSLKATVNVNGDADLSDNTSIPIKIACVSPTNKQHLITTEASDSLKMSMGQPVNFYATTADNASIYYANEMGINRGKITSMAFNVSGSDYRSDNFKVYIGETDITEFDSSTSIDPNNLTLVFDGRIHFPSGASNMVIPFDVPYDYNGGNIIVYTERFAKGFVYGRYGMVSLTDKKRTLARSTLSKCKDHEELCSQTTADPWGLYSSVIFNMEDAESGSVAGIVRNSDGQAISGAVITISGECMNRTTGVDGRYAFKSIASGKYTFTATYPGYYPTSVQIDVNTGSQSVGDIVLTEISKQKLTGRITDTDGNPVAGAQITITGEVGDVISSGKDGSFSTELYGESEYHLSVNHPFYHSLTSDIQMNDKPIELDFELEGYANHPYDAKASNCESNHVNVSWQAPIAELRHDTGSYVDCIGYDGGYSEIIFGSAYHQKAIVKEISWYMTDTQPHDNFHVFVFGLTDGNPDANKILYRADDVQWEDNCWNTHVLTTPVEADGFMVAVSCAGFMSLGITDATDEYPYVPDTEFYAGDSYRFRISEISTSSFANNHWMLRAGIDIPAELTDLSKPSVNKYLVYRFSESDKQWNKVGETESNSYSDDLSNLSDGRYRWGVEAEYGFGVSSKAQTEGQYVSVAGVESIANDDSASLIFDIKTGEIRLNSNLILESTKVYSVDGKLIYGVENCGNVVSLSQLPKGSYVVTALLSDGSVIVKRIIL